jgi:opacity protein-like surface antigen
MKTPQIICLLALAASGACASTQGFFVSGNVGGVFQSGNHVYISDSGREGKQNLKSFGAAAGASVGYLHETAGAKLIFGGEVFGAITTLNAKKDLHVKDGVLEGKVGIKPKNFFGAAILAGMPINPRVILYGRLGYEFNRFAFDYSNLTFQTPTVEKYNKTLKGLAPGAGALYKLTDKLIFGAEYVFSLEGKVKLRDDKAPINGAKRGYVFSGHAQRLMARLIYVF